MNMDDRTSSNITNTSTDAFQLHSEAAPANTDEVLASTGNEDILASIKWMGEQIPGGFFVYRADASYEILYVNDIVLTMFGCETGEEFRQLTGNSFRGMVHPEDYDLIEQSIRAQINNEDNSNLDYVEYRIIRRDDTIRWVEDYGHFAALPELGEVYYVFLVDITEKHQTMVENRRRAQVIEGLSIDFNSIYLIDLETGNMQPYRMQNAYFRQIAEDIYDSSHEIRDFRDILPEYAKRYILENDQERYLKEISGDQILKRLNTEPSYTVDYRLKGKDSEILYMQMSIVRIEDESHGQHAVMGYRDITEQTLRLQQELAEKLNIEMNLEREKRSNEIKSSFLFNISHDIRTPMNAIMGFTELAKRHMDEPERLIDYLDKVDDSSRHMLSLIDDLLEMSQIHDGRIELKYEQSNLTEQIETVLDIFRSEIENKQLTLEKKLELPEKAVMLDAHRFQRVLSNIISNSVKFTPEHGTIRISACCTETSESGYARYEIKVADTGIGMSEEFMKRMFEAFEREVSSTVNSNSGTGLGLTITKNLLDIMGGSLQVESTKGAGSVFTIGLPLKSADHSSTADGQTDDTVPSSASDTKSQHRILLVEDIEINRVLAETILEEAGYLVASVPDGCDAVDAITNHPEWYYDLVLMDIQLPVMNGYEATRAIRALKREDAKTLPIIALSANARDEDRQRSMESGMNHHIAKPFDVDQLIQAIQDHIRH